MHDHEKIAEMARERFTNAEIMAATGASERTIQRVVRAYGIPNRHYGTPRQGCTHYDHDLIVEFVRKHPTMPQRKAAKELGVSHQTIYRVLKAAGMTGPSSEAGLPSREERMTHAKALLDQGYPITQVANMAHVGRRKLARMYPEFKFTKEQASEAAALGRQLSRLKVAA